MGNVNVLDQLWHCLQISVVLTVIYRSAADIDRCNETDLAAVVLHLI